MLYPLFVCHTNAPKAIGLSLKNVHINPDHVCSGESADTKRKWSVSGQEGFCAKMPTRPKYAWLCSSQPQRCCEMLKQISQGSTYPREALPGPDCAWCSGERLACGCSTASSSPTSSSGSAPFLQKQHLLSALFLVSALPAETHARGAISARL